MNFAEAQLLIQPGSCKLDANGRGSCYTFVYNIIMRKYIIIMENKNTVHILYITTDNTIIFLISCSFYDISGPHWDTSTVLACSGSESCLRDCLPSLPVSLAMGGCTAMLLQCGKMVIN